MRDASRLKGLRALLNAQELVTSHARQTAAENLARETKLRAALSDQEAMLESSLHDWSSHLASRMLEPQQIQRLGAAITRQDAQRTELAGNVDVAASATEAARRSVATADAHARLTGDAAKALRKSMSRDRDEAAAEALEDRMAYNWSQA
jgi:hypothetical protein